MAKRPGIFPTFFLSGFECSNFFWGDGVRRNLVAETGHDRHAAEDYQTLNQLGIAVAREGIQWPMVDQGGSYDFSSLDPFIAAMNAVENPADLGSLPLRLSGRPRSVFRRLRGALRGLLPRRRRIRDPEGARPAFLHADQRDHLLFLLRRRMGLGRALSLHPRRPGPPAAGAQPRGDRRREGDPRKSTRRARMVHIDPLVQVVAPRDRPDQVEAARRETSVNTFLAWDIICGREHPEFGGSPEILDIVGANNYSFGQMEYRENGPHAPLAPGDDRIMPLCDMLDTVWQRYRRPMIIGETSGIGHGRASWLRDVMGESLAAVRRGMDLQGICLFPAVDMPDWHSGEWVHNGICDVVEADGDLRRVPNPEYVAELRRWQTELNRVTQLDEDPFSDPVELQDVIDAAQRLECAAGQRLVLTKVGTG